VTILEEGLIVATLLAMTNNFPLTGKPARYVMDNQMLKPGRG
jgi:hypothetical protein